MAAVCSHGENPSRTRECLIQTNDSPEKFREGMEKKTGKPLMRLQYYRRNRQRDTKRDWD